MCEYSVSTKRLLIVTLVALAVVMSGQRAEAQPGPAVDQTTDENRYVEVRLEVPLDTEMRSALLEAGIRITRSLSRATYLGEQSRNAAGRVPIAVKVSPWDASRKLSGFLKEGMLPAWAITARREDGTVSRVGIYALLHNHIDIETVGREIMADVDGLVVDTMQAVNGLLVFVDPGQLPVLAEHSAVFRLMPALPAFGPMNAENRVLTQAQIVQAPPYDLDGTGVSVLLYDTGVAESSHPDFGGRLTERDTGPPKAHATHVGGTIGGDGFQSGGMYRGMAPNVTIESYHIWFELPDPPDYDDIWNLFYNNPGDIEHDYVEAKTLYGTSVANNSIGLNLIFFGEQGCPLYGEYGVASATIDALARGDLSDPIIICWAAGNPRSFEPGGPCGVEYMSLSVPSNNKNAICVGAVDSDTDTVTDFTAFGPTKDGRLKPDICAPGCQVGGDGGVTSTKLGGGYWTACGTSMATPTMTGLVALLLQDYRTLGPSVPDFRNATAKALLVHTAVDIEEVGPDFRSGYGSVRVRDAIDHMRDRGFVEGELNVGEVVSFDVEVPADEPLFQATLVWDDAPGAPSIEPEPTLDPRLINDLDLEVYDPQGARRYPWTLDPDAPMLPAVQSQADHLNNIEQVRVADPMPGTWRIDVRGFDVPEGPQSFSLTATPVLIDTACLADVDGSGDVGVKDLLFLLGAWGACPLKGDCPADFDNSGDVGVKDLLFLLGAWGACP
ncbi:MAG: S8 family serine peptidase [Planctomycetes bacterium]|nr:S8 family serine peptidase [Planctomycetota bacterium]